MEGKWERKAVSRSPENKKSYFPSTASFQKSLLGNICQFQKLPATCWQSNDISINKSKNTCTRPTINIVKRVHFEMVVVPRRKYDLAKIVTYEYHHHHWLDSPTWALVLLRSFCQLK
jgi:hypothetical protein